MTQSTPRQRGTYRPHRGSEKRRSSGKWLPVVAIVVVIALIAGLIYTLRSPHSKAAKTVVQPVTQATQPVDPESVRIVLDLSGSMAGYTRSVTSAYIDVMANLRNLYPGKTRAVWYEAGGSLHGLGQNFIEDMRAGRVPYQGESLLYGDLGRIGRWASAGNKRLALYVTDGIMSFDIATVKQDPSHNITFARDLQGRVMSALQACKGIGVALYQFAGDFTGTYYCYDNSSVYLNATPRYFYIIALGSPAALADFKAKADNLSHNQASGFSPSAQWLCIERTPLSSHLTCGPGVSQESDGDAFTYDARQVNTSRDLNHQLKLGIPYTALTNYSADQMDAFADNARITIDGVTYPAARVANDRQARQLTLTIDISQVPLTKKSTIKVVINDAYPAWITQSSVRDDHYMTTRTADKRTFQLNNLVEGLAQGVRPSGNHTVFERTFMLIKQ